MSPQLRQINVSFNDIQDRLLLKVSTTEDEEYRVWCTRRFTRLLLEKLEQTFEQETFKRGETAAPVESAAVPSQARREVAQMKHQQSVAEESFQQAYEAEPATYPLGQEGILATTLKFKQSADQTVQLHLGDKQGKGVNLNLNPHLLHQAYELFARAAERAEWFESRTAGTAAVVH